MLFLKLAGRGLGFKVGSGKETGQYYTAESHGKENGAKWKMGSKRD